MDESLREKEKHAMQLNRSGSFRNVSMLSPLAIIHLKFVVKNFNHFGNYENILLCRYLSSHSRNIYLI